MPTPTKSPKLTLFIMILSQVKKSKTLKFYIICYIIIVYVISCNSWSTSEMSYTSLLCKKWKEWIKDPIPTKNYSSGTSSSPALISSMRSWGGLPSTVHPTDWHVPKISLTVPLSVRDIDLDLIARAMETMSSNDKLPLCLIFFCLLRSLGGSFSALIIKEAADGTTEIVACLFWMVNWTVIFKPFQSLVALAMSSPTFLGD